MKTFFFSLVAVFMVTAAAYSQNGATGTDKIYKHSGEVLDVKVQKVGENDITFKYPGEDAEQVIGKLAVSKIVYGSGRTEQVSEKITVDGKDDWEKVEIVTAPGLVLGLKKGEEIKGKTAGFVSYNTAGSADKKATRRLKEAAAAAGAPYILLTSDKSDGFGVKQSIKKGILYTYK